jgi:hypothetical protein
MDMLPPRHAAPANRLLIPLMRRGVKWSFAFLKISMIATNKALGLAAIAAAPFLFFQLYVRQEGGAYNNELVNF